MALPEPFSDVEHLQLVARRYLNKQIREDFRDLHDENGNWDPEVNTTRGQMLRALLHEDSDPIHITTARMLLYYFTYRKARDLQAPLYGIPTQSLQESVKFLPQIRLFFSEDLDLTEDTYSPVEAEHTFRLMGETEESMNEAKARILANRIKTLFCEPNGFVWKKGKELWLYKDLSRGYKLQISAWNESEAKKVVEQILDIQQHTPDWKKYFSDATKRTNLKATPATPPKRLIYGKQRREPRHLPIAYVRFRYAELKLWGMPNDIQLVDKTGTRRNPIIIA